MVLEKVNFKSALEISQEIENVKNQTVTKKNIMLDKKSKLHERLYYHLPGFLKELTRNIEKDVELN